jgi:hypothetical protein
MRFLRLEHDGALENRIHLGSTIQYLEQCIINKQ